MLWLILAIVMVGLGVAGWVLSRRSTGADDGDGRPYHPDDRFGPGAGLG